LRKSLERSSSKSSRSWTWRKRKNWLRSLKIRQLLLLSRLYLRQQSLKRNWSRRRSLNLTKRKRLKLKLSKLRSKKSDRSHLLQVNLS